LLNDNEIFINPTTYFQVTYYYSTLLKLKTVDKTSRTSVLQIKEEQMRTAIHLKESSDSVISQSCINAEINSMVTQIPFTQYLPSG